MTEIIENNMRLISDAPQAAASEAGLTRQCGLYYTLPRFLLPLWCTFFSNASVLVVLLAARLLAHDHPTDVNVVVVKDVLGLGDGGDREGSGAPQDPGEVNMKQPQNISAGVDQGRVFIVSGQDPVWGVGKY